MIERRYTDRHIYGRVLREARPYWGKIFVIFLLSLLATPIALLLPVPLKVAVDNVIGDEPLPGWADAVIPDGMQSTNGLLVLAVLLLVGMELLSQVQQLTSLYLRTTTGESLSLRFRALMFRHSQRLSLAFHDRRGTADSNYRIQDDAQALHAVAVDGVIPFVGSIVMVMAMLFVVARIDLMLALIAIVVAPVLVLLTWWYRRRLRERYQDVKALESSALGVVQEVLTSLRVVKAFGQEDREQERFLVRADAGMRARVRVTMIDGSFWLAIGLVTALGTAAVLYTGVRRVESGAITLGSLILVMAYLTKLYDPLFKMSVQVATLQSGLASAERAFTLLDEEHDVPERPDAIPLARATGAVEFRGVSFAYDEGRPVLEDVTFAIQPGSRVGIAGRTGAGKSTLVSLLTRFYDPTSGTILLDGLDIRDYRVADLRDQFAIVLQEPVLFSTTIGDNIAYGRPEARPEEIAAAADAAGVRAFVESLPDGYDTLVGERGMSLSGGERQRISLARAFLKDAPILILDEPTSSVDIGDGACDHGRDGASDGGPHDVHDRPPSEHTRDVRRATRGRSRPNRRPPGSRGRAAVSAPLRLVVVGTMAGSPYAGMAWMHMQIVAGLRRLGHDASLLRDDVDLALRSAARREGVRRRVRRSLSRSRREELRARRVLGLPPELLRQGVGRDGGATRRAAAPGRRRGLQRRRLDTACRGGSRGGTPRLSRDRPRLSRDHLRPGRSRHQGDRGRARRRGHLRGEHRARRLSDPPTPRASGAHAATRSRRSRRDGPPSEEASTRPSATGVRAAARSSSRARNTTGAKIASSSSSSTYRSACRCASSSRRTLPMPIRFATARVRPCRPSAPMATSAPRSTSAVGTSSTPDR